MKLASVARGHANLRDKSLKQQMANEQKRNRRSICATKNLNGAMSEVGHSLRSGFRAGAFQCPLLLQERSFEAWVRNHVMGQ